MRVVICKRQGHADDGSAAKQGSRKTDQPLICSLFARFIHEKDPGGLFCTLLLASCAVCPACRSRAGFAGHSRGARLYESDKNRADQGRSGAGRRSGPRRRGSAPARSESRIARVSNRRFARRFAKESPATAQLQGLGSKKGRRRHAVGLLETRSNSCFMQAEPAAEPAEAPRC